MILQLWVWKTDWKFHILNNINSSKIMFTIFKNKLYIKILLKCLHYILCKTDCIFSKALHKKSVFSDYFFVISL